MPDLEYLADRLRVAVQGCTLHIHGPVQAWLAIVEEGDVVAEEVLAVIMAKCQAKMTGLHDEGVALDDPRVLKEMRTVAFCSALLSPR